MAYSVDLTMKKFYNPGPRPSSVNQAFGAEWVTPGLPRMSKQWIRNGSRLDYRG